METDRTEEAIKRARDRIAYLTDTKFTPLGEWIKTEYPELDPWTVANAAFVLARLENKPG